MSGWPCPFTLPVEARPEWARPPEGVADTPGPCTHGKGDDECIVAECTCTALDGDGLCEGHWLDTK